MGSCYGPTRLGLVSIEFWCIAAGGGDQCRVRADAGLGAGTLHVFPDKKIVDALVDLPFALPTAVAGIALTALYAKNGWLGQFLEPLGIKVAFGPLGVLVALVFIGLPFVVRTVQPILEDFDTEFEEAAASLGARAGRLFRRIILPILLPALMTGFALAFARAVGEYGSVIFIAGNIPMVSEITPLMIITKLEQYEYDGATAIAAVMLVFSFALLLFDQRSAGLDREARGGTLMSCRGSRLRRQADRASRFESATSPPGTLGGSRGRFSRSASRSSRVSFAAAARGISRSISQGLGDVYLAALVEPDALSAIRLTLLAAAIAVPLNLVFGVAAAWSIAKFDFPRQAFLDHPDRPAVLGFAGRRRA